MNEKKIKQAIKEGKLIPWDKIFASYPKERQERILQKVRFLRAAIELRKVRRKLGLSQADLAKKMDVKREFISRIESGRQNITLETLYKIADTTGRELKIAFR